MAITVVMKASTIARANIASAKKATLNGYKRVEPSLLTGKNHMEETRMEITIARARANSSTIAQVVAAVKPTLNDRISIEPNTLIDKNCTEELRNLQPSSLYYYYYYYSSLPQRA